MRITQAFARAALAATCLLGAAGAQAGGYPDHPIKWVVPSRPAAPWTPSPAPWANPWAAR